MQKLNQVLAIEQSKKAATENAITSMYRAMQQTGLFQGLSRNYRPKADGDGLPAENKFVQARVEDSFTKLKALFTEMFDLTATKDSTNCVARADVIIDGITILKSVPVAHLLWLEKKLVVIAEFIKKLPALDPSFEWSFDAKAGVYKTAPVVTTKTRKTPVPVMLSPATDKHPAQVQVISEDVVVGEWDAVHMSGALPASRIEELAKRVETIQSAVKSAREQANMVDAVPMKSSPVLDFIFSNKLS